MALIASTVMARAAGLCNDRSQVTYTNTLLLPHLQTAALRLQAKFQDNDLPTMIKHSSALALTAITSVAITQASSPALPTDLVTPIQLWEKVNGEDITDYIPMHEVMTLPIRDQQSYLIDWEWREDGIYLVGATRNIDVLIEYEKSLAAIASENSSVTILDAELYLAAQTAALAAFILGGNQQMADANQAIADDALNSLIRNRVKSMQNLPSRRLPYGYYRRNRRR